jgi:pimeloyl-ACP methyl ester carboxylesterase
LIYFVPGNPGLIEYYYDFLTHLASLLDPDVTNIVYHVVGHSLGGFELSGNVGGVLQLEAMMTGYPPKDRTGGFHDWGLARQQAFLFESLRKTVELIQRKEFKRVKVMVVGHSVGAYLMMQSLKWRHKAQIIRQNDEPVSSIKALALLRSEEHFDDVNTDTDETWEFIGGVGLFPTIVDLAGSPRGRMLAVSLSLTFYLSDMVDEFRTDAAAVASGQAMVVRNHRAVSCLHPPTHTWNPRPAAGQVFPSPASERSGHYGCVVAQQIRRVPSLVCDLLESPIKCARTLTCKM